VITTGAVFPYSFTGRQGTGGTASNNFNIWWNGSTAAHLYIDNTDLGAIAFTSDRRMKTNIAPIGSALAGILQLQPVTFNWRNPKDPDLQYGLIAQDVQRVLPTLVRNTGMVTPETPDGMLQVNYQALVPLLLKGMQEMQAEIDQLKKDKAK
jgi:hypothetical protein